MARVSITAGTVASRRLAQLEELGVIRAAAAWLSKRPQLGVDIFARGAPKIPVQPRGELIALLETVLVMLEGRRDLSAEEGADLSASTVRDPARPGGAKRIRALLERVGEGAAVVWRFLPEMPDGHSGS